MFNEPWYMYVLNTLAAIVMTGRFVLPVSGGINKADIYKDLAHIFVGFCIGFGFYDDRGWWVAGALTIVEIMAFIVRRKRS